MAKIIEAKAIISAQDNTGATFDKIAKKIDGLAKSAKTSKAIDEMSKSIERAKTQMVAIDKFDLSRGGLAAARQRFNETKTAVENAARAMASVKAPTREMEANFARAQKAVSAASQAFESQRTLAISHKRAVQDMGINISQAAAHQTRLRTAVERTSAAIDRQAAVHERSEDRRLAVGAGLAAGGAYAAHAVKSGAKATLHTYREFDKERRFGKAVMGITDEEQKPLVNQAVHMGATTKFNDIQVLEAQRELAARGLKKDQIMGMMSPAANLGSALDLKLPDAVKQMEGAIFGFKKDISTLPAALASATQTADYQVKAAKLSGMTPEDLTQLYKFGATPARMSGISEASLLGFGGILKKANIGGDEAGVAFRALTSVIQSPTRAGKEAMLANGMNYKNYQRTKDQLDVGPFAENVAASYGVNLDGKARGALGKIFSDKEMISDPAKFAPAVTTALKEVLGGNDAKSLKSIAGAANRYRDSSVNAIDANAMIKDLLPKLANNLPLANKLFGSKQGGRIATALGDSDTLKKIIQEIEGGSDGYAGKIATERMAGFDGAVSRFEGAIKNLETSIGRSFDRDGKGGLLTGATDMGAKFTQWLAERDSKTTAIAAGGVGALGLGGVLASGYGMLKLLAAGPALTGSAAALSAAAAELAAAGAVGKVASATTGAAATAAGTTAAGGGMWAAGAAALPWLAGGAALLGGGAAIRLATQDAGYDGLTSGERMTKQRGGSMRDTYRRAWGYDSVSSPEISPTMTYGTGVGNGGQMTAALTGSADVKGEAQVTVKVEAGSTLLQVVEQAQTVMKLAGKFTAGNGPGSVGKSSPDAGAPSVGASGKW